MLACISYCGTVVLDNKKKHLSEKKNMERSKGLQAAGSLDWTDGDKDRVAHLPTPTSKPLSDRTWYLFHISNILHPFMHKNEGGAECLAGHGHEPKFAFEQGCKS